MMYMSQMGEDTLMEHIQAVSMPEFPVSIAHSLIKQKHPSFMLEKYPKHKGNVFGLCLHYLQGYT